jgi:LPS-assembly protein
LLQFDADTNDLTRATVGARYQPRSFHTLSVAYRSNRPKAGGEVTELLDLGWQWPLNQASLNGPSPEAMRVYGVGRVNYSVPDSQVVDALAGLEFDAGCWIARVLLEQRQNTAAQANWRVLFQLELSGFARVGSNPLSLLGAQVPGYQVLAPQRVTPSRWENYD